MADTSRKQEAGLGKIETTRALRRTSRCKRSTPLVVRNKRRKEAGKAKTVSPSGMLAATAGLYVKAQNLSKNRLGLNNLKTSGANLDNRVVPIPTSSSSPEERRKEMIYLINQERISNGRSPLKVSELLNQSALLKAQDMLDRGYWAHNSPEGVEPWRFFQKVGFNYSYAGENLARDIFSKPASYDIDAWMNSPKHQEVMLDPAYSEVGIGLLRVPVERNGYFSNEEIAVAYFGTRRKIYDSNVATNQAPSRTGKIIPYHDWCNNKDISVYENEIVVKKSSDDNVYGMTVSDWESYERFLGTKN